MRLSAAFFRATSVALLIAMPFVSAGCSAHLAPSVAPPATSPAPAPVAQRVEQRQLNCIDVTTSIPRWFVERALDRVAADIESAVTGPMLGATFFVRSTVASSYSPDAELATVELPAVPVPPPAPELSPNMYETAANEKATTEHQIALADWDAGLDRARQSAEQQAARIRTLDPAPDSVGTDVLGCPWRAPGLLGTTGDRRLVIFSDLIPSGPQQDALPPNSLTGVALTVVLYCAEPAGTCAARLGAFDAALRAAGVTDIEIVDPQNLGS